MADFVQKGTRTIVTDLIKLLGIPYLWGKIDRYHCGDLLMSCA